MDLFAQMKIMDLMLKYMRGELSKIGGYPYVPQKERYNPDCGADSVPLPREVPEEMGISSAYLRRFIETLAADRRANVHTVMVLRHGRVIAQGAFAPWRCEVPQQVYSLCKSVVGMAIGIAEGEGLLSRGDRLIDLFPDKTRQLHSSRLGELTVEHLLTMTSGVKFNEIGSVLERDWARAYMESDFAFDPGCSFAYNSLNSYMLAAAVCRRSGMSLMSYLEERLFVPLGISGLQWERCPEGIEKGGWGLYLRTEDMAKLGQLYLNGGLWQGKRLLPEEFVRDAVRPHIRTENGECDRGYGYQVWMCPMEGAYQFNGMFGQYVVVHPALDMVIAVTAGSENLFGTGPVMEIVERFFGDDCRLSEMPLHRNRRAERALGRTLAGLSVLPPRPEDLPPSGFLARLRAALRPASAAGPRPLNEVEQRVTGRKYRIESAYGGLLPLILQAVHGNYSTGFSELSVVFYGDRLIASFTEQDGQHILEAGMDGAARGNELTIGGETYLVEAEARWARDEDENPVLKLFLHYIETPDTRLIKFRFSESRVRVDFSERPSVELALHMLGKVLPGDEKPAERPASRRLRRRAAGRMSEIVNPSSLGQIEECEQP